MSGSHGGAPGVGGAPTLAEVRALDAADPLAHLRDRFDLRSPGGRLYVDGNSLGVPPRAAADALAAVAEDWAADLVGGWERWLDVPERLGDRIGTQLLGARPGEVVCCDSVTVDLHKLAGAALAVREGAVLVDPDDFPTDRYVLAAQGREVIACRPTAEGVARTAAAAPGRVALAVFSAVDYRSGAQADLRGVTDAVHAAGGLVLWDLSHAAGAVEVDLEAVGADLAVGCTYKFLAGGPGAPAFLYVRATHQDALTSPIPGWFGAAEQFAMGPTYAPRAGVGRFLAGTPSIVALAAVAPGVELLAEAGIAAVAAKGRSLTGLAVALHDAWLAPLGFELGTPREAERRGAHVALRHPEAWAICRGLIDSAHVLCDFRGPDVVRFGFQALATSHEDVHQAVGRLRDLVAAGTHREVDASPRRVT